ncbi:hypothetical protein HMPREF9549_04075 [Escherichia coli MS 185-1]|nr:hypothetical protein HMPREF9549_04075 [Escherichia coli MS 185-1]EGB76187.1 hypothetical protein HMPREF9532_03350 [Escherichia coli MS 57-2]ESE27060.1 hypothetical protein HMPREF1623_00433 [Escherichia coli 910096-2]
MQAVTGCIFNVFKCHAAAGIKRGENFNAPVKFSQKAHQIGFVGNDLNVGNQCFQGLCRKRDIILAAKFKNGLGTNVAIKVAMDIS